MTSIIKANRNFPAAAFLAGFGWTAFIAAAQQPGTFTVTGSMSAPREGHTATLLPNGKVLIAGGISQLGPTAQSVSTAELYDPSTGSFSATGSMSVPRISHTATLLPDGRVLIVGGNTGIVNQAIAASTTTAELYDPGTGTFTSTAPMSVPRSLHTATLLNNGKVLIAGGVTRTAELYDPVAGVFTRTGNMTTDSWGSHLATLLVDGRVLIVPSGDIDDHRTEIYDPASGTFNAATWTTDDAGYYGVGATATLTTNGKVLVTLNPQECDAPGVAAGLYDSASGQFIATRGPVAEFCYPQATLLSDGSVLVAGGWWFFGPVAQIYDPASGAFSRTSDMTTDRLSYAATLLNDGTVLMSGGTSLQVPVATAELYHPAVVKSPARLLSLAGDGSGAGAIQHAGTYQVVSDQDPAAPGETVIIYCTGLINGGAVPPQVSIGGRMADVLWFGNTPGYPGLDQMNVRIPVGVAAGNAVPVRMSYLSRPSNDVSITVR
jgi:hypothetical protein